MEVTGAASSAKHVSVCKICTIIEERVHEWAGHSLVTMILPVDLSMHAECMHSQ